MVEIEGEGGGGHKVIYQGLIRNQTPINGCFTVKPIMQLEQLLPASLWWPIVSRVG